MKKLVIGLGNPILGDDGIGWKVAERVQQSLPTSLTCQASNRQGHLQTVEVECASLGGLSLMERLLGYEHVILVDSIATGQNPIGSVEVFPLERLSNPMAGHSASPHDVSLLTALKIAVSLGANIPKKIDVVAIETQNLYEFSEELTPPVAAAVPIAAEKVLQLLQEVP
ncbi:MAG: hydrogenase maturation protease [Anaerolineales bacterium]